MIQLHTQRPPVTARETKLKVLLVQSYKSSPATLFVRGMQFLHYIRRVEPSHMFAML